MISSTSPVPGLPSAPSYKDVCRRRYVESKNQNQRKVWKPVQEKENRPTRQAAGATAIAKSVVDGRAEEQAKVDAELEYKAECKRQEREHKLKLLREMPGATNEFMARAEKDLESAAPPGGCDWSIDKPEKTAEDYRPTSLTVAEFYEKYTALRQTPHAIPWATSAALFTSGVLLPYAWLRRLAIFNSFWVTFGGPRLICRLLIRYLKLDQHKGTLPDPPPDRTVANLSDQQITELAAVAGMLKQRPVLTFKSIKKWFRDLIWRGAGLERLITIERKGYHTTNNEYDVRGQDERNKTMSYLRTVLTYDRVYYHASRKDAMLVSDHALQQKMSRQPLTDNKKWLVVAERQAQADAPTNLNSVLRAAVVNGTPNTALVRKLRYADVVAETELAISGFCPEVHPVVATLSMAAATGLGMYLCQRWLPSKLVLKWQRTFNRIMYDLLFKFLWAPNWSALAHRCRTFITRLLFWRGATTVS